MKKMGSALLHVHVNTWTFMLVYVPGLSTSLAEFTLPSVSLFLFIYETVIQWGSAE